MQTSNPAESAIDTAVRGLGYELVAVERMPGGLMRVTIDFPWAGEAEPGEPRRIGVADCEKVSRQLQHVLEVEGASYQRLEVSSPGLDRPLRRPGDFERFEGELVEVTLRAPLQGRKHWRGALQRSPAGWRVVLPPVEPQPSGTRRRVGKVARAKAAVEAAKAAPDEIVRALDFSLDEVREARLVPAIDFKGRRRSAGVVPPSGADASG